MVLFLSGGRELIRKLGFESADDINPSTGKTVYIPCLSFFIYKIKKPGWIIFKIPSIFGVHLMTILCDWSSVKNKCWFMNEFWTPAPSCLPFWKVCLVGPSWDDRAPRTTPRRNTSIIWEVSKIQFLKNMNVYFLNSLKQYSIKFVQHSSLPSNIVYLAGHNFIWLASFSPLFSLHLT